MADKNKTPDRKTKKLIKKGIIPADAPFDVRYVEREKVKREKKRLSPTAWAIIITSVLVLAAAITAAVLLIADAYKMDKNFDYIESDLTGYLSFSPEKYKEYEVQIDIAEPHRKNENGSGISDVEIQILNLLCAKREQIGDGNLKFNETVEMGDTVHIWYRGYLIDNDGNQVPLASSFCNFASNKPTELAIGANSFSMIGFDVNLIGVDPTQYARFTPIKEGTVSSEAGHIAYVSYSLSYNNNTSSAKSERIVLADGKEKIDEKYGEGFFDFLNGTEIGRTGLSKTTTLKGKEAKYTNLTVNFVTLCESKDTNGGKDILTIETYFPYNYGTTGLSSAYLRNETAYFEVYIKGVVEHTVPELNDDFITELISAKNSQISASDLDKYANYEVKDKYLELFASYDKSTLVYKYLCYVEELLWDNYVKERNSMIEDEMWTHYLKSAAVKRYPGLKVENIYNQYVEDLRTNYNVNKDKRDEYGELVYEDIDAFAAAYLNLLEGEEWEDYLREMSQNLVKERLILFYIMKAENLTPTAEEYSAKLEEIKQEYIDEYVRQYLEKKLADNENYDEHITNYDAFLDARKRELFDYYDEEYFSERAYYEYVIPTLLSYATVTDLDNSRAYPFE